MGFSRQEYWSGLPFPAPGDLPDPGIEPASLVSPALAGGFFTAKPPRRPLWAAWLINHRNLTPEAPGVGILRSASSGSGENPLPGGRQTTLCYILTLIRKRDSRFSIPLEGSSPITAPPPGPHPNLVTFQRPRLQTPSHWGPGFNIWALEERTNIQPMLTSRCLSPTNNRNIMDFSLFKFLMHHYIFPLTGCTKNISFCQSLTCTWLFKNQRVQKGLKATELCPTFSPPSLVLHTWPLWNVSTLSLGLQRWLSGWRICLHFRSCRRHGFDPWVGKIPGRRSWQPTPVFLPGKSHGQRSLVGYSPKGRRVSLKTEHVRIHSLPLLIVMAIILYNIDISWLIHFRVYLSAFCSDEQEFR